jgi:hypothetical protein
MNLVSLLILPTVITLRHNDAARFAIAASALVVILGAVAFSKRKTEGFGHEEHAEEPLPESSAPPVVAAVEA